MADPPTLNGLHISSKPPWPSANDHLDFMTSNDPQFDRLKEYARSLPYTIESNERMQNVLDFLLKRCVYCRPYSTALMQQPQHDSVCSSKVV
jgi:proteasome activator subunit 4